MLWWDIIYHDFYNKPQHDYQEAERCMWQTRHQNEAWKCSYSIYITEGCIRSGSLGFQLVSIYIYVRIQHHRMMRKNRCNFAFVANDRKRVEMYKILSLKQRQLHFEAGWWNTDTVFSLMSKIQMFWTFHLSHTVGGIRFSQICLHIWTPCYTEPSLSHQEYL